METLSHGNQQRVQLTAALVHNPELLVLDEPLSGLDPTGIDAIGQVLVDQARAGCCVLFSSHQLDQVEDLCEQVTIIDHGRLVVSGTVDELATSGARRLVVRIEGDRTAEWARHLPGVTVSEVERRRRPPGPGELGRQRRRSPGGDAGRAGHPVLLRASPSLRGVPGGAGVKYLLIALVAAAVIAVRVWILQAPRRRRAATGSRAVAADRGRARPGAWAQHAARAGSHAWSWSAIERLLGDVGIVAGREIRERVRGRIFRIGTLIVLLAVAAAIVIPTLHHGGGPTTQTVGVVGTLSPAGRAVV